MKNAITMCLAAALLALAAPARAGEWGFLDADKAMNECSDGKKAIADAQAAAIAHQKSKADAAANAKGKASKPAGAVPTDEQFNQQQNARFAEAMKPVAARMLRILPVILKARKLSALAPLKSMAYVPPTLDVTDELVRRYNAGEGATTDKAAELAAAKAKVAALEREAHPPPAKGK